MRHLHLYLSFIPHPSQVRNYWAWSIIEMAYFVPALVISYWIFWVLIQNPLINRFFSVTTLTHYYSRFHDPETRLKDMVKKRKQDE